MELEELDANLMEFEEYRCRTCLFASEKTMCFTQVNQLCYPHKTVKDILVQMVPQMEATVSEEDRLCRACLKTVISFAKFIDKCLEIETQLTQDNEEFVKNLEEETLEQVEVTETTNNTELGNVQIVENIEIVVENDLEKPLDHDHVYIKTEMDDENEDSLQPVELQHDEDGELAVAEIPYEDYESALIDQEMLEDGEELMDSENGELLDEDVSEQYLESDDGDQKTVHVKEEFHDSEEMLGVLVDPESVICEICGKLLKNKEMLCKHLSSHEETLYQCSECPKIFKAKQLLRNHLSTVHEPDIIGFRYQCSKCNKLFKNKGGLNAHYKLLHMNLSPFVCQICMETFGRADYLKKHMQTHAEDKEKKANRNTPGKFLRFKNTDEPLPCKICGKFYNGINKLKVHLQTHVVVKRYQCEYCSLTYKRWPSLKRHEKTHLEADENFHRCNVCWKRLKTEEELKLHMASHGNPKYQCHICDEQFHRKYLFDNHYLLEHATPEDLENSRKEIIYDTLLELSNRDE